MKTVFLENGVFVLLKTGGFSEKMAKMTTYILPTKTRGCAPQTPETDENDENGGCPSDKTIVCQKHRCRHPEGKHGK